VIGIALAANVLYNILMLKDCPEAYEELMQVFPSHTYVYVYLYAYCGHRRLVIAN
jgi:hypothetical protein